jgi:hypothetical protein
MSEVLDLLNSQLDERKIREIASHLGTDESQTEAAIAAALPTLVSAMGRRAESDEGSSMLAAQMQGIGGGGLGELLGSLLGAPTKSRSAPSSHSPSSKPAAPSFDDILPPGFGQSQEPTPAPKTQTHNYPQQEYAPSSKRPSPLDSALGPGNELPRSRNPIPVDPSTGSVSPKSMDDILGNVLGGKQKRVEESIGKSSGLDLRKIGPLLAILAPLVLGAMKVRAGTRPSGGSGSGIDPRDLSEMMRNERGSVERRPGGSMIGRMLDQDGDGDFDLSDIMKLGMRFLFSGGRR